MMVRVIRTLLVAAVLCALPTQTFAQSSETIEYYHLDVVGSVRTVTNQAGQVVRNHDYFPFGDGSQGVVAGKDPLRFTGKERDAETGLDYFGARYYASRTGRMTSVDPLMDVEAALVDPQQWNRYAYARNNPLVFVDPTGAAIELIGNESDRKAALALLQSGVGDAGGFLYINELEIDGKKRYFVGIRGDVGRFMRFNQGAHTLANLVMHQSVVEFGVTKDNLGRFGGAVTFAPGEATDNNVNTRVLLNASQVRSAADPNTIWGAGQFEPNRVARRMTPEMGAWHEFGHAWGLVNGRPLKQTNPEALDWENIMRQRLFGPLGPDNARRTIHR
jgi:RHS repeat-associated protein